MSEAAVNPSRKPDQPYHAATAQPWVDDRIRANHEEALYLFGELCIFTLMWRPVDFEEGRVDRCSRCWSGATTARYAEAFKQATDRDCPKCYGSTFEGGFRAQIIRPALFADRNHEMSDQAKGTVQSDTIRVETTGEFVLRKGDYIFRFDNSRFQVEEKNEDVLRDGFGPPRTPDSMAGSTSAHREEETAVAFKIPPVSPLAIRSLLAIDGPFLIEDLTAMDLVQTGGYI